MLIPFLLLASQAIAQAPEAKPAENPLDRLQGKWRVVAMERDGRAAPKFHCDSLLVTHAGDRVKLTSRNGAGPVVESQVRLDPKNPKVMDLIVLDGPQKGQAMLGIYEFDGKTLKTVHTDAGAKVRPTEFEAPAGSFHSLMVLEREKE